MFGLDKPKRGTGERMFENVRGVYQRKTAKRCIVWILLRFSGG
jgi:hypothetical protein